MDKNSQVLKPYLTGDNAERFIEFLSQKTFLKPWVFKNPKCKDGDEFSDVVIFFRDILILIEVKGNKFDSQNLQRYLKEAKERHRQLKRAEGIAIRKSKQVCFKNDYFSFESDFDEVKKIHLISISAGHGEMEVASGLSHIDYSKLDHRDVGKYLGFFDPETNIHSFTVSEMVFASEHIDTIKDFGWYLEFEKKFFKNDFETKKREQVILPIVDTHREDLISIYILTYYWDEELNITGKINLNKILGQNIDLKKADMVMYAGTDTRKYLDGDETYKKIKEEKKVSYFWDNLINFALKECTHSYRVTITGRKNARVDDIKEIIEEMSAISRFERVEFSRRIKETDEKGLNFRNIFSKADGSETLFSYSKVDYKKFPAPDEQEKRSYQHLYGVWCRIEFSENLKPFKDKIKKTLLITRHTYKNQSAITFGLSTKILVDEKVCKKIGIIKDKLWKTGQQKN